MPYATADIEATQPLPAITLSEDETGLAVLLRRKGRPAAFWMEDAPAGSVLAPEDLAERISARAGAELLRMGIREELTAPAESPPFPALTIAVCTKDRPKRLARCLRSLQRLAPPDGADAVPSLDVLVVDNAPSDGQTRELVASLPHARYVCEPRPGLDFARNRATEAATGELLAFLDDDVVVDGGWLAGLAEAWAENPDAAAFTGLVLPYELATDAQILFEQRGGFRRGFDKIRYHGPRRAGNPLYPGGAGIFGAGANMAFRRAALQELGGFDEALDTGPPLPGGGDLDIFYRVVRAGYPLVYEPRFLVFHEHRRDLEALRRQYYSWGQGFMAFVVKSHQADPLQRAKLRRLVGWWFGDQLRQLHRSLRGRHPLPPPMILAELWGGVVGLLGEYPRSQRRTERIKEAFA